MSNKLLLFLVGLLASVSATAQDIHFTQFNMSPMTLNPAMIGKFEGTVRLGGIFRGQWASVIGASDQYKTPAAWADAPIIRGFRKKDWVGLGLSVVADKAGVLGLTNTGGKLGASYHLALDKKGKTYLSVGFNYGSVNRKINRDKAEFGKGLETGNVKGDYDYMQLALEKQNYTDADAGLMLSAQLNKTMDFNLGFGMFHLLEPEFSLLDSSGTKRKINRRPLVHGQFNMKLNDRFTVSPQFQFQTMAGSDEIQVQAMGGYLFNPERDITLRFGAGYRLSDAVQAIVGAQIKNLQVGLAYDINTSDLNAASNYRGGFELAANYIVKIYKKAQAKPKILCPRF
ncbi:MAG: PorP/SprF family type IX secretion system membrane protein [Saprospiraceae bacterium]|nr:PorP/SprF family type IX secretion system membrane protein [Saprospiraceae bacterium]